MPAEKRDGATCAGEMAAGVRGEMVADVIIKEGIGVLVSLFGSIIMCARGRAYLRRAERAWDAIDFGRDARGTGDGCAAMGHT